MMMVVGILTKGVAEWLEKFRFKTDFVLGRDGFLVACEMEGRMLQEMIYVLLYLPISSERPRQIYRIYTLIELFD